MPDASATDEFLRRNRDYAARFGAKANLPRTPTRRVAVVTCMDARLRVYSVLGLEEGDAHILRNAGGLVTDDMLRSLVLSQRLLGTTEVIVIAHTDCGMTTFTEEGMKDAIEAETGHRPPFEMGAFDEAEAAVRDSVARLRDSPFLPKRDAVRGFVYDVRTGLLHEVR